MSPLAMILGVASATLGVLVPSAHDATAHDATAHDAIAHDAIAHDAIAHDAIAHDAAVSDAPGAGPAAPTVDRSSSVDVLVDAVVASDLSNIQTVTRTVYVPGRRQDLVFVVLAADRAREPPGSLLPSTERSFYPSGLSEGGFEDVRVRVDGIPCEPHIVRLPGGERVLECAGAHEAEIPVVVEVEARLRIPRCFGPFGLHANQLTLAGGWYPYVAELDRPAIRGRHRVRLTFPSDRGVVVGGRYFPALPAGGLALGPRPATARVVEYEAARAAQVGLVILPHGASAWPAAKGSVLVVSRQALEARVHGGRARKRLGALRESVSDGLAFLADRPAPLPTPKDPLLLVLAPLRHDLALASEGAVLVSDRAFRLPPVNRFLRFHRFPVLREVFTTLVLRGSAAAVNADPNWHVGADAVGAWLVDEYVRDRFGRAEDAFDVLSLWSWIPAIDSMLYAPQLPFVGAYFRLIDERDPWRPNFIDFPSRAARGKVVYEKLIDRRGRGETERVFAQVLSGKALFDAMAPALGEETESFLSTWLGPYPQVRYRLGKWGSRPAEPHRCRGGPCFEAHAEVVRDGDRVKEPVAVAFRDARGAERVVTSSATDAVERIVTATIAHPLESVVIDPFGRLAETPTPDVPAPQLDNQSSSDWRWILNSFNLLLSASEGQVDTSVDIGLSRVRDVRFSHAVQAAYGPDAVSLSGRSVYGFGPSVTPEKLSHWIGLGIEGDYLRPEFAGSEAGAFASLGTLFYGFDDRTTVWAPEPGTGVRLALQYSRVFGELPAIDATRDALSLTARFLRSWRFDARHQISLRAGAGGYLAGRPLPQLLYAIGGRRNARGYAVDDAIGRFRAIVSAEWVHALLTDESVNVFEIVEGSGLDGALYADAAVISEDVSGLDDGPVLADVGYGLRIYLDYFGVRPGVMAIDVAIPLVDPVTRRPRIGRPAVYIDFAQSFLLF